MRESWLSLRSRAIAIAGSVGVINWIPIIEMGIPRYTKAALCLPGAGVVFSGIYYPLDSTGRAVDPTLCPHTDGTATSGAWSPDRTDPDMRGWLDPDPYAATASGGARSGADRAP